jgi:hypothetical protein
VDRHGVRYNQPWDCMHLLKNRSTIFGMPETIRFLSIISNACFWLLPPSLCPTILMEMIPMEIKHLEAEVIRFKEKERQEYIKRRQDMQSNPLVRFKGISSKDEDRGFYERLVKSHFRDLGYKHFYPPRIFRDSYKFLLGEDLFQKIAKIMKDLTQSAVYLDILFYKSREDYFFVELLRGTEKIRLIHIAFLDRLISDSVSSKLIFCLSESEEHHSLYAGNKIAYSPARLRYVLEHERHNEEASLL